MLSRTRYAELRQMPPPILISECAIRLRREDRKAGSGGCLGGRQADKQTDCGCRFRLEKHPEQSKPVSVHRGVAAAVLGEIRSLDRGLA
jgi:hypothetical protein